MVANSKLFDLYDWTLCQRSACDDAFLFEFLLGPFRGRDFNHQTLNMHVMITIIVYVSLTIMSTYSSIDIAYTPLLVGNVFRVTGR